MENNSDPGWFQPDPYNLRRIRGGGGRRIQSILCRATFFAQDDFEEYDEFILLQFILFFKSSSTKQLARQGIEYKFCPANSSDDLRPIFCLYPFSTVNSQGNQGTFVKSVSRREKSVWLQLPVSLVLHFPYCKHKNLTRHPLPLCICVARTMETSSKLAPRNKILKLNLQALSSGQYKYIKGTVS